MRDVLIAQGTSGFQKAVMIKSRVYIATIRYVTLLLNETVILSI